MIAVAIKSAYTKPILQISQILLFYERKLRILLFEYSCEVISLLHLKEGLEISHTANKPIHTLILKKRKGED